MRDFAYRVPKTLDAAFRALSSPGAVAKAGGVDLLDLMKEGIASPAAVVQIAGLPGLDRIDVDAEGRTRIGPLLTLAELAEDQEIRHRYPALAAASAAAATPQVRNQATLGGNLCQRPRCWYFRHIDFLCLKKGGDTCFAEKGESRYHALFEGGPCHIVHPSSPATALMAYDAVFTVSRGGGSREVPASDFFTLPGHDLARENVLEPGELITAITLPSTGVLHRHHYLKQREKQAFDWPIAEVAVVLKVSRGRQVADARLVLGAAAPRPYRATAAEQMLIGKSVDVSLARSAAEEVVRQATPLPDNGWRIAVFRALIRRAILGAVGLADPALTSVGGAPALSTPRRPGSERR